MHCICENEICKYCTVRFIEQFLGNSTSVLDLYAEIGITDMRQLNNVLLKQLWKKANGNILTQAIDGLTEHCPNPTGQPARKHV